MSYVERKKGVELEITKTPLDIAGVQPAYSGAAVKTQPSKTWLQISRFGLNLVLIYSSFLLAYLFRFNLDDSSADFAPVTFEQYLQIGALYTTALLVVLYFKNFYSPSRNMTITGELMLIGNAVLTTTAGVTFLILVVSPTTHFSRLLFIYMIPITWALLSLERAVAWKIRNVRWAQGVGVQNLIVVGATDTSFRLMRTLAEKTRFGYKLVGFVDDEVRYSTWTIPVRYGNSIKRSNKEVPHLGGINQLRDLIEQHKVGEVIVALPMNQFETISGIAQLCLDNNVHFTIVPTMLDMQSGVVTVREINGVPLIVTDKEPLSKSALFLKRSIDILGSLALLLVAAIPMTIVAIAIKLDSRGPIIFRQTRVGKNNKTFTFYKFRSMYVDADIRLAELEHLNETNGATFKMKRDPRVTRVGRFIRRTSIDELPQLFNVLFGQMSLVGPRPGLPREVTRYQDWHYRRLEVTPGLTGLWQVSGRSALTFEDMVKLDIYYVEHWSIWMDIKILFKTVKAVLQADGAY
ncbi:MAG TPA: sugar transferase [Chloroflexia bacterium]|nr:sugar transferase [Chloroflexia bacterium]